MSPDPSLPERLAAAGVDPNADPRVAWQALRAVEGPRATVIDLYALVAAPRGLAPQELPAEERLELARWMLPQVWPGWTVAKDSERVLRADPMPPGCAVCGGFPIADGLLAWACRPVGPTHNGPALPRPRQPKTRLGGTLCRRG